MGSGRSMSIQLGPMAVTLQVFPSGQLQRAARVSGAGPGSASAAAAAGLACTLPVCMPGAAD